MASNSFITKDSALDTKNPTLIGNHIWDLNGDLEFDLNVLVQGYIMVQDWKNVNNMNTSMIIKGRV